MDTFQNIRIEIISNLQNATFLYDFSVFEKNKNLSQEDMKF